MSSVERTNNVYFDCDNDDNDSLLDEKVNNRYRHNFVTWAQ